MPTSDGLRRTIAARWPRVLSIFTATSSGSCSEDDLVVVSLMRDAEGHVASFVRHHLQLGGRPELFHADSVVCQTTRTLITVTGERMSVVAIIPVYNRAQTVLEAIGSVADQSHLPDRLIVVDDGSTDNFSSSGLSSGSHPGDSLFRWN